MLANYKQKLWTCILFSLRQKWRTSSQRFTRHCTKQFSKISVMSKGKNPQNTSLRHKSFPLEQFSHEYQKKAVFPLGSHCFALWLATKTSTTPCTSTFSRPLRQPHVIAAYSDWLITLFACAVIDQSNYFGFGFTIVPDQKHSSVRTSKQNAEQDISYVALIKQRHCSFENKLN